jgi:succinate-semialdehyde dehydrogenase / glutarate-semialdehyde dehydrogenase
MAIESINPATGELMERFEEHDERRIEAVLERALKAQRAWRELGFSGRAAHLAEVARVLREDRERLARMATEEMGKPIVEAEAEVEKCAVTLEWFCEHGERLLQARPIASSASESYVQFVPLGVVLAVMPWNFPFWQFFRAAGPALSGGNTMVLKHASNVPRVALAIEEIFERAGVPEGVAQTLLVGSDRVPALIADERMAAVTLTGSDVAGAQVASAAGKHLKKSVLELGGSDPFIVLADADVAQAAKVGCRARNQNNGQSCIAAKRFIVEEPVFDEFQDAFLAAIDALEVGDPLDRGTNVGPLARGDLVDGLRDQLDRSLSMGAEVLTGGRPVERPGWFFQPTVVGGVSKQMPVFREETFGPLAALIKVGGEEEAIAVANDSRYGLGSALWTGDVERGKRLAGRIEAGLVFINGMVASEAPLPFGGVKRSGYGRELSDFGMQEFQNVQTVWVGPSRK